MSEPQLRIMRIPSTGGEDTLTNGRRTNADSP